MTEAIQAAAGPAAQRSHAKHGAQATAAERAREAFFTSFSRELRWALDEDDRFLLLEGAWQSVLGWRPEQLHGWRWDEIVHPEDQQRFAESLARLRAGDGALEVGARIALERGGYLPMRWTLVAGAGPDSVLGLGHDGVGAMQWGSSEPTRRSLLERHNAQLTARLAELEDRYDAVERFAGTAAHQLAEPLVIAESSAILVADELGEDLDPALRDRLDAIGRGAARARRLMDALLADARAGDVALELRPVDLAVVVEETVAAVQAQIEERRATVVCKPLPPVQGDPGLLAVIVENLLSNALKYGPRRNGTVTIEAERRQDRWRIRVTGDGSPIPAEEAAAIFRPFHRAAGERRIPGVGLGLTICARLVARLGGTIGVEPGAEQGNSFWFELQAV